MNSGGDVVGVVNVFYENDPEIDEDDVTRTHGFLWSGGNFTSYDFPGSASTQAYGISARGEIAGAATGVALVPDRQQERGLGGRSC